MRPHSINDERKIYIYVRFYLKLYLYKIPIFI